MKGLTLAISCKLFEIKAKIFSKRLTGWLLA